jgi:hypothetical protein
MRQPPSILVATEVLAEGLDLQGASRVVHVDLPWHPARLEQRTGRVQRPGQLRADVEVVTRYPPPAIERLLDRTAIIAGKRTVADRWMEALQAGEASACRDAGSFTWMAAGEPGEPPEAWVGLSSGSRHGTCHVVLSEPRFASSASPDAMVSSDWRSVASRAVSHALTRPQPPRPFPTALMTRLLRLARDAAVHRDAGRLRQLDRLLEAVTRDGPLGYRLWLDALGTLPDAELGAVAVPSGPISAPTTVSWVALRLPADLLPRYLDGCRRPVSSCSTSTGR